MKKLVVGQFNDSFSPIMDGVGNVVKNYSFWLNKKYGKCYTITPAFPNYTDNEDFEVIRYFSIGVPMRSPYRLGLYRLDYSSLNKLKKIPFDILHAHCPFSSGKLALDISKKQKVPIIATFHSKYFDDFKEVVKSEKLARYLTSQVVDFYNAVDFVWTVNESTAETLRSYGFNGNIEIMYNGTDFESPINKKNAISLVNKELDLSKEDLVFCFVGQHIWQKNIKLIVDSLKILNNKGIDFRMLFVGEGIAQKEIKNMVINLGLEKKVKFLGVIKDRELLKDIYLRADLFLFPSLYDTSGIVVKEAAACECPSVLIEGANAAQGIIDNYNGFLSNNDAKSYANKIYEIIKDKEKLQKVGKVANKTISENWENIVDKVSERYLAITRNDD